MFSETVRTLPAGAFSEKLNNIPYEMPRLNSDLIEEFAEAYIKCREKKIIKIDDALEIVKNPLVFAALSVHLNYSDGTVGGAISTTSDTVRTALNIIGLKEDKGKLSSFFLIDCDEYHLSLW